jgi:hypothetical protein
VHAHRSSSVSRVCPHHTDASRGADRVASTVVRATNSAGDTVPAVIRVKRSTCRSQSQRLHRGQCVTSTSAAFTSRRAAPSRFSLVTAGTTGIFEVM